MQSDTRVNRRINLLIIGIIVYVFHLFCGLIAVHPRRLQLTINSDNDEEKIDFLYEYGKPIGLTSHKYTIYLLKQIII